MSKFNLNYKDHKGCLIINGIIDTLIFLFYVLGIKEFIGFGVAIAIIIVLGLLAFVYNYNYLKKLSMLG